MCTWMSLSSRGAVIRVYFQSDAGSWERKEKHPEKKGVCFYLCGILECSDGSLSLTKLVLMTNVRSIRSFRRPKGLNVSDELFYSVKTCAFEQAVLSGGLFPNVGTLSRSNHLDQNLEGIFLLDSCRKQKCVGSVFLCTFSLCLFLLTVKMPVWCSRLSIKDALL